MNDRKINKNKVLVITNIFFVIVIFVLLITLINKPRGKKDIIVHDEDINYVLTNPILDCELNDHENNSIIYSKNVSYEVEKLKEEYMLDYVSLYFRDLNNGPWVGVNEKEEFSPASLLKVPMLMAFLQEAESNKSILDKRVVISPDEANHNIQQNITFENTLVSGQEYSLLGVTESMIIKSDNTAVIVLLNNIKKDYIANVFKSVGVPFKDTSTEVSVNVKEYAGFFRVLFNASYLDREMSEKALEILTKTEYVKGLVAGVPQDIKVAHKFGEREIRGSNIIQLHDCGIVYYPERPYVLCIMTRGSNFNNQEKVIKELSSYVYNEVNRKSK